mgnify:CR=1 FL=1
MKKHRDRMRHLRQAVRLVWDSARGWTALQALVIAAQGVLPVATLVLTRQVVDAAGGFLAQAAGARDAHGLLVLAPGVVAVVLAGWICRALSSIVADAQSAAVSDHVQDALQQKSIEVDLACYETSSYYDQMRMAQSEAMARPTSIVRNLVQLGSGTVVLGSVVGVLWVSQGLLLPILLAAALPGTLARIWNSRRWHGWRMANSVSERYAGYLHLLLTGQPFAKEIRLSGNGNELRRQHRELRGRLRRSRLALTRHRAGVELAADALSMLAMVAGLGVVYLRMRGNAMTLGDLALLYGGFQRGKSAFSGVLGSLASLYEDSLFISHFYRFLGLPLRVRSPEHPKPMPRRIEQGIRLEHVSFRYPGMDRDVLRDIDLTIRAGEHVALVGENGSGKTTLVKLLCRLYDPTGGRIWIDGTDIREFSLEELRTSFSALFQDFVRYQMTAGENVRMGDVAIPSGDPRIAEAARRGGAAGLIEQLPAGYDTPLGRLFEGGSELSEGQWQRVALARAFVRDAPFVMLDEPTSSLDAKAERQLLESVVKIFDGKTSIVVSHRFSTVQAADRILVLAEGRIAESGTHEQLVRENGVYAGLFALHART